MKNITPALLVLALTGCATQNAVQSAPQQYRAKNSENQIIITGKLDQKLNYGWITDSIENVVLIKMDGQPVITGALDNGLHGEFKGRVYKGHETSASCSGSANSATTVKINCIVFIDNERTVTLTF